MAALCSLAEKRGYSQEDVMECVVSESGGNIIVDIDHRSFPSYKGQNTRDETSNATRCRPGAALTSILSGLGFKKTNSCSCGSRARQMDAWGCDESAKRLDQIVGWLEEEAKKNNYPFVRIAAVAIVKLAIRNARRAANL
jgi:hypothetical protein